MQMRSGRRSPINLETARCSADVSEKPVYVVIWTTTPWTLPANQAVSVNPDAHYAVVDTGSEYLLLADALADSALQRYGIDKEQTPTLSRQMYRAASLKIFCCSTPSMSGRYRSFSGIT